MFIARKLTSILRIGRNATAVNVHPACNLMQFRSIDILRLLRENRWRCAVISIICVIKTLRFNSLFPSATVALDGDLYISGGFNQKVYRVDKNFEIVREYKVGGFVGGLAPVDSQHLAVAYMATQKDGTGGFVGGGLGMLSTATSKVEREIKAGYYPYTVRHLNGKLFVTVLGEDKVFVFDRDLNLTKEIPVGRTPQ